jgi:hypothetical protein
MASPTMLGPMRTAFRLELETRCGMTTSVTLSWNLCAAVSAETVSAIWRLCMGSHFLRSDSLLAGVFVLIGHYNHAQRGNHIWVAKG